MSTDLTRPNPEPPGERPESGGDEGAVPAVSPERRLCAPPIDIYETEQGLVLCADLPGVAADGLELQVQDNKLTLFGRIGTEVPDDARLLHQEYYVCDFLRSFILSDEVDHDRISAKINNGVLEVVLPKAQRAAPRKIQVRTD